MNKMTDDFEDTSSENGVVVLNGGFRVSKPNFFFYAASLSHIFETDLTLLSKLFRIATDKKINLFDVNTQFNLNLSDVEISLLEKMRFIQIGNACGFQIISDAKIMVVSCFAPTEPRPYVGVEPCSFAMSNPVADKKSGAYRGFENIRNKHINESALKDVCFNP